MKNILFVFLFLMFSIPFANATIYKVDPTHTRVIYFVSHLGFSNFMGHFNKVTGLIEFNPQKAASSKVDVSIEAKSVSMDDEKLDADLIGKDFFNAEEFPAILFKSTNIKKTSDDTGELQGSLTLLGITKPVTLDVKFNHKGFNKFAQAAAVGFTATGKIKRSDFGMNAYLPVVGDEIEFRIEVEAHADSAHVAD